MGLFLFNGLGQLASRDRSEENRDRTGRDASR